MSIAGEASEGAFKVNSLGNLETPMREVGGCNGMRRVRSGTCRSFSALSSWGRSSSVGAARSSSSPCLLSRYVLDIPSDFIDV